MRDEDERRVLEKELKQWEETALRVALASHPERRKEFVTTSSRPVKRLYTPLDLAGKTDRERLGQPGEFPYTRGIHPTMYRGRLWTMRMFAGYGSAEDTNRRFKYLIAHGETGLSVAFDVPILYGYDRDEPEAKGEFGTCGVAVSSLEDMRLLFRGIDVGEVSTSMTINSPASVIWAMYLVAAEERAIPMSKLRGTIQNDILKEYQAQKEWIFPPEPSMRLVVDTFEFGSKQVPQWNTISISGYHIREAGATAGQELAFTPANGLEYVRRGNRRGPRVGELAARIALRTQQILAHESGVANTVDPLGGSYFLESLTDELEDEAYRYFDRIQELGGVIPAIRKGFFQQEIANSAYRYQREIEDKERVIVGVNDFVVDGQPEFEPLRVSEASLKAQVERLRRIRRTRDAKKHARALHQLRKGCEGDVNTMPPILDAGGGKATLGEIIDVMRETFGVWEEPLLY